MLLDKLNIILNSSDEFSPKYIISSFVKNNLYEIRSKRASNIQRAIYFNVKGSQYIITNAFTKKTQKTPENQKEIARNRRSQYLNKEENQ